MVIPIPKYVDVSKANADPLVFRVDPERLLKELRGNHVARLARLGKHYIHMSYCD